MLFYKYIFPTRILNTISTDASDPEIQCSADITENAGDAGTANVDFDAPTCDDNSGVYTASCDYASGDEFSIGDTTVTCECVDPAGNRDECDFTITVIGEFNAIPTLLHLILLFEKYI